MFRNTPQVLRRAVLGSALACTPMARAIVYVDASNTGSETGMSWALAFRTVQQGIDAAEASGDPEVWVAAGTYQPTHRTSPTEPLSATFLLKDNIIVYGGFAGGESSLSQRDWETNLTVLDGDLGLAGPPPHKAYHVVSCLEGTTDAGIDGFTIKNGYANGPGPGGGGSSTTVADILLGIDDGTGGGIINYKAAATVRNCTFTDNWALKGGGAYNMVSSLPGGDPGDPYPHYENCTFIDNTATKRGAGVANDVFTHATFDNCRFYDNRCEVKGGGMYNDFSCSPVLTNCIFAGNYAVQAGALGNDGSSSPTLTHCVLTGNTAWDKGAAIYNGSHNATAAPNLPTLHNCILFDNAVATAPGPADIETWHDNFPVVTFSIVEDGYEGAGNQTGDPLFTAPGAKDFTLGAGSAAIDTGDNANSTIEDMDGIPRPLDGDDNGSNVVDLGAHEYVNLASDSDGDGMLDEWELEYGFHPTVAEDGLADADGDGFDAASESEANTDPFDHDSHMSLLIGMAGEEPLLILSFSPNRYYTLLRSDELDTWEVVPDFDSLPSGPDGGLGYFFPEGHGPPPVPTRLYKLQVEASP